MGGKGASVHTDGSISGQVVVGDRNIVVHADRGSTVTLRTEGPPPIRRRGSPAGRRIPARGVALVGRDEQLAHVAEWLAEGYPVQINGPAGCGKSALLRHLVADHAAGDREVVLLSAAGLPVEDVVEDLFHACYDAEDYKPDPARRRRLMGSVQALLAVDDFEGSDDDLAALLDAAPGCDVVIACAEHREGAEGRALRLDGLPEEAALALIARKLDRSLDDDERASARRFTAAVHGNPSALVQAAAALRAADRHPGAAEPAGFALTEESVAVGLAGRLSEPAARLLNLIDAFRPLPVSGTLLEAMAGDVNRQALEELESLGLVRAEGDGLRLGGRSAGLVVARLGSGHRADEFTPAITTWVRTRSHRRAIAAQAAVIRHALNASARAHDHAAVRELARAAAPALARTLRWGTWHEVLELGRSAARASGAVEDEAYFAHEEEVRRKVLGVTAGLAITSAATGGAALGHAAAMPAKAGPAAVAGNPAVLGAAVAALLAGGFYTAFAVGGNGEPPDTAGSAPLASPRLVVPSPSLSDLPTWSSPGMTVTMTPPPSHGPGPHVSKVPNSGSDSPVPSSPTVSESKVSDGSQYCPPATAVPDSGDAQFGPVTAGEGQESVSFSFAWLKCDNESSLSVRDQAAWSVRRTSCPPALEEERCVFSVTFRPPRPGDYQTRVTVLDDWGRPTVQLDVSGTAVDGDTAMPTPTDT
ncbi:hypothetical protein ACWD4F_11665 [Streptomyces aureus]